MSQAVHCRRKAAHAGPGRGEHPDKEHRRVSMPSHNHFVSLGKERLPMGKVGLTPVNTMCTGTVVRIRGRDHALVGMHSSKLPTTSPISRRGAIVLEGRRLLEPLHTLSFVRGQVVQRLDRLGCLVWRSERPRGNRLVQDVSTVSCGVTAAGLCSVLLLGQMQSAGGSWTCYHSIIITPTSPSPSP